MLKTIHNLLKKSQRKNPFTNNRPGIKWFNLFLKIQQKKKHVISKGRATVMKNSIRLWFSGVLSYLKEKGNLNILNDGCRVINFDKISL